MADAVGDTAKAKVYRELEALWRKREDEKEAKLSCVCGKSPTGICVGICGKGE